MEPIRNTQPNTPNEPGPEPHRPPNEPSPAQPYPDIPQPHGPEVPMPGQQPIHREIPEQPIHPPRA